MSRAQGLVALALLFGAAASVASAQTTSATLVGTVRDDADLTLPGFYVQARSLETGLTRAAITDRDGHYEVLELPPGLWSVAVHAAGGEPSEARTVLLQLQQTTRLDFTVQDRSLSERVVVTAEAPLVDRARTEGRLRLDAAQIASLPLPGRSVSDLARLDPAVAGAGVGVFTGERRPAFVANGQGGRSNSYLVDGLDNNDPISGTDLNSLYSLQVVREFTLLTDQYAPEFGRASGGVLNIVTRQGTNEKAWGAFAQGSSASWNQTSELVEALPSDGAAQEAPSDYALGFNLSGPLVRDRAFWLFAYERRAGRDVVPFTGTTREGIEGGSDVADSEDDNLFLRTDFNFAPNHQLMLRLGYDEREDGLANCLGIRTPENATDLAEADTTLAGSLKSVLGPSVVHELRVQVAFSRFEQQARSALTEVNRPSAVFGGNDLNRQQRDEQRLQLVDNLTWKRGAHLLKVGIDVVRSRIDLATDFNPNGGLIYESDVPFDPSLPETFAEVWLFVSGHPREVLRDTSVALFAQDSWDVNPKLHLNYGLRYDMSTFVLGEGQRVDSVVPNGGAKADHDNFAPRFGFTYTPGHSGKLVVRGGAGLFYDKVVLGFPAVAAVTSATRIDLYFPQGFQAPLDENFVDALGGQAVADGLALDSSDRFAMQFSTAPELDTPYTVQYDLGFEVATGRRSAFRADAVRSLGHHLPLMLDLNPVSGLIQNGVECTAANLSPDGIIPCHLADPALGSIGGIVTSGRSWYWGLNGRWSWRGDEGAWLTAGYSLSRAEDLGFDPLKNEISIPPDSTDLSLERGRTDSDRRHRVVFAADLPLAQGFGASGVLQASSGVPYNVTTGRDDNLDGILTDRPDGVRRNSGEDTSSATVAALRAAEGLAPLAIADEPNFVQLDVRAYKRFPFAAGRGRGELFLQVFNVLDRDNALLVEGRALNDDFGRAVLLGEPRTIEFGLQLVH